MPTDCPLVPRGYRGASAPCQTIIQQGLAAWQAGGVPYDEPRHAGRDRSSGRRGIQSGFSLEFPWNFYGFRDILIPNMSRENMTFRVVA